MADTAGIGDNSKALKERRLLFSHYHRIDRDLAAQIKQLQTQKSANRQQAKAAGFNGKKMEHYLQSFMAEDHQKPVDKLKSDRENLEWLGYIPETSGGDLLKQMDRVDNEQLIQAKGFHAGVTGLDRVSGYDAGSSDDRLWLESYDAGKKEYDSEIPDILARIEAAASKEEPPADVSDGKDPFSVH